MKTRIYLIAFLAIPFLIAGCGGADDDSNDDTPSGIGGSWELGNFSYTQGTSNQNTGQDDIVVVVASTANDTSQGAASGSAVTFVFYDNGSGQYIVSPPGSVAAEPDAQLIEVSCTIGTATQNATRYDADEATSGNATITKDDGVFTVSIAGSTLVKTIEIGDGVPNAADSYLFTVDGVE